MKKSFFKEHPLSKAAKPTMQGDVVATGSRVSFIGADGKVHHDVVRGFFWQHHLLEPYARNRWSLGVCLTQHSWVEAADILPPRRVIDGYLHASDCPKLAGRSCQCVPQAAWDWDLNVVARNAIERHLGDMVNEHTECVYDVAFSIAHSALVDRGVDAATATRVAAEEARKVATPIRN